jgi:hypothetical protein
MPEWFGNVAWPAWGWWLAPLVCMALCVLMCLFLRWGMAGRRFCRPGWFHSADVDEMKKEIAELKEIVGSLDGKKG